MIILDTLRVRPISQLLDGSKAQAVKISAAFGDNPRLRELAWIKPSTFVRVSGVSYNDRAALNSFTDGLRNRLAGMNRSEAVAAIKRMGV